MARRPGVIQPNTPAPRLVRALLQAERTINRVLRPTCVECGSRMQWGVERNARAGGEPADLDHAAHRWSARAMRAEEGERHALEGAARNAARVVEMERELQDLSGALDSAGRPGEQARALLRTRELLRLLSRADCPSCHQDLSVVQHKADCELAAVEEIVDRVLMGREAQRPAPAPRIPASPEAPRARAKPVEDTWYGKLRAAVSDGRLVEPFGSEDLRRVLKMRGAGPFLSGNAEGAPLCATPLFVRVSRGVYRLKEKP